MKQRAGGGSCSKPACRRQLRRKGSLQEAAIELSESSMQEAAAEGR